MEKEEREKKDVMINLRILRQRLNEPFDGYDNYIIGDRFMHL